MLFASELLTQPKVDVQRNVAAVQCLLLLVVKQHLCLARYAAMMILRPSGSQESVGRAGQDCSLLLFFCCLQLSQISSQFPVMFVVCDRILEVSRGQCEVCCETRGRIWSYGEERWTRQLLRNQRKDLV